MSEQIRMLQLGHTDWRKKYILPPEVHFSRKECFFQTPTVMYDIVFIDRAIQQEEMKPLFESCKAYTLFVTDEVEITEDIQWLLDSRKGRILPHAQVQDFLDREIRNYYSKPYGEKFDPQNLAIAQGFQGAVTWDGNYAICLDGDYGPQLSQIAYWRNNVPIYEGQAIDFWLEYEKDPEVEIALEVIQFCSGTISKVQQVWHFTEAQMQDIVTVDNEMATGPVFLSLQARGKGRLKIIALHDRYSRRGHGFFLPGGKRLVSRKREEIFYYLDPGDMKPPLNIYFSGYKTRQGFEGYFLMKKMGCPFLLISDPRLTGGAFYMGDEEYEKNIFHIIQQTMEELGFDETDVIMSGLSMGTYGALYYGCDIRPHALILGKPLTSLGNVAEGERLHRPGGFPTSLDVLKYLTDGTNQEAITALNRRFWDKFELVDWSRSKFVVAYMIEDDYDGDSYNQLISHIQTEGVQVYGKGIHGRHNDATNAIAGWFKSQYEQIVSNEFARGENA